MCSQSLNECEALKTKSVESEKQISKFKKALATMKSDIEASFKQHHASSARRSVSSHVGDDEDETAVTFRLSLFNVLSVHLICCVCVFLF